MRRDKTFARILLILSIAIVVLAAPAVVRQRRFVIDRSGDESTDESTLLPYEMIDNYFTSQSSATSGIVAQGPPPSMAGSLHQDPAPVSGTSELHHVPPFMSGNLPSQPDPPLGSEAQPLLDHPPPASEATQLHKDPLPGSGTQPFPDDMHPLWDEYPVTEIEEVEEPDFHDALDVLHDQDDYYNIEEINKHDDWEWSDLASDASHIRWPRTRSFE